MADVFAGCHAQRLCVGMSSELRQNMDAAELAATREFSSVPSSVWDRISSKLCFDSQIRKRERVMSA